MSQVDVSRVDAALDSVLLGVTGLPPIVWPNSSVDAPPTFLRIRRMSGMSSRSSISHDRKDGMLQIEVYGAFGEGDANTKLIGQQIAALYPKDALLDGYVRIIMADVLEGAPTADEGWWMTPVQVDWRVEYA